jgi:hypothetical protein
MTSPGKGIGSVIRRRIVSDEGLGTDTVWQNCTGLYEKAAKASALTEEPTDAPCFPKGDPQGRRTAPSLVRGCANFDSEGDLDFDGTSYWPDWPKATKPTRYPAPFLQQQPRTRGALYSHIQFQTNAPASEASCGPNTLDGCAVPPPGAPGNFYPWWTLAKVNGDCVWEFGQMANGKSFGRTAQYGTPDLSYFFGTLKSATLPLPTVDAAQSFNFTAADTRFPHRERRPRTRPRRCQPDPATHRTGHNTDQRGHRRRHHRHSSHRRRPRHCVRRRHPETHHTNLNVVAGQPPPTSSSPVSTPTAPSLSSTVPAVPSS